MTENICDVLVGDSLTVRHVSDASFQGNYQVASVRQSGTPDPSDHDLVSGQPQFSFSSTDLAGLTGGISVTSGLRVPSTTTNGVTWITRARNGATYAGGSSERATKFAAAHVVLDSISVSGEGTASGSVMAYAISEADTDAAGIEPPVTDVTTTAPSQANAARYVLGAISLNAGSLTTITRGISATINTGIEISPVRENGLIYPVDFEIRSREPTIELTFQSWAQLAALIGSVPQDFTAASVALYARDGMTIDDSTTLTFSFGAGAVEVSQVGGSGTDPVQPQLTLRGQALSVA